MGTGGDCLLPVDGVAGLAALAAGWLAGACV